METASTQLNSAVSILHGQITQTFSVVIVRKLRYEPAIADH
jgi:hypothetical protein